MLLSNPRHQQGILGYRSLNSSWPGILYSSLRIRSGKVKEILKSRSFPRLGRFTGSQYSRLLTEITHNIHNSLHILYCIYEPTLRPGPPGTRDTVCLLDAKTVWYSVLRPLESISYQIGDNKEKKG
jgi:hypothetical protein